MRSPHPLFDVKWYLECNPTVSASGVEPLKHYLDQGWKEERDPHPLFSVSSYIRENPDVQDPGIEPLTHYVLFKLKDSRPVKSEQITDAVDSAILLRRRFTTLVPLRTFSATAQQRRVNLITDSISEGTLFGGAGTAIIFSVLLAESWSCPLRIITRTQKPEPGNVQDLLVANNIVWEKNIEFLFARIDDNRAAIDVSSEDFFVTTSWWTTWSTLQAVQTSRIIYLLQEDERLHYPEGDEKLRCQEVISNSEIRFIVSSQLLYRQLTLDGFANLKERGLSFEPSIIDSTGVKVALENRNTKNFFFGARPGVKPNLFYLGLEVIERALLEGILIPDDWTFFFVGKDLVRVRLNGSIKPILIQEMSWSEYTKLISCMDLGLSLTCTRHPSYSALDLAAFGGVAVTNSFGIERRLESYSKNIIYGTLSIQGLIVALEAAVPLVHDRIRRRENRANDQILRDWRSSFQGPINQLAREFQSRCSQSR
jgi:O-antigen biosynthesis protein